MNDYTNGMNLFNEAIINAEIEKQNKEAKDKAIKLQIQEFIKQGVDKEIAKAMAKSYYECGLIKSM